MAILTVTQLNLAIKKELEGGFSSLSVRGEVSNLKEQSSGHLYFTLKDESSQISAVLFQASAKKLARPIKSGDQLIVRGDLSVYTLRGNYQILVKEVEYAGIGELLLRLHELKLQIHKRGWFDQKIKKPLPKQPQTIGVITSPSGAVIQDILHILSRRARGFHLILNPVRVQGDGASIEIAKAIEEFNHHKLADVLIVGRGGGSLEDLFAFNEECVAAAIHASTIPTISAVGHETDHCIADYVADYRAPTPSAAAEIVMANAAEHEEFLSQISRRINQSLKMKIAEEKRRLYAICSKKEIRSSTALLAPYVQRVDELTEALTLSMTRTIRDKRARLDGARKEAHALKPSTKLEAFRDKLSACLKRVEQRQKQLLFQKKERLDALTLHLKAIDPKNLLIKGYCILFSETKDSIILSAQQLSKGQGATILLHDGEVKTVIQEISNEF